MANMLRVNSFEGEEPGEQVVFNLRPHQITNLPWIIITLFLVFSTLVGVSLVLGSDLPVSTETIFLSSATFLLIIAAYAFQKLLAWYFNIYILTNRRIVDLDFHGLFYRSVSQTTLKSIEDITFSKGGIFQNFFDYGDMSIQTAGTLPNFEFSAIPDPEGSQKAILDLIQRVKDHG